MAEAQTRSGLVIPVALRFFAGFVGFCLVACLALGCLGLWWLDSLMKKMLDPGCVREIAQSMATYEKPLWPKYKPLMGLSLGPDVKLVSLGLAIPEAQGQKAEKEVEKEAKAAGAAGEKLEPSQAVKTTEDGPKSTKGQNAVSTAGKVEPGQVLPGERFFLVLVKPAKEASTKELLKGLMASGELSPEGVVTLGKVLERGQDRVRLGTVDFLKAEGRDSMGAAYTGYVACLSHKGKMLGLVAVHPASQGSDFPQAQEFLDNLQGF